MRRLVQVRVQLPAQLKQRLIDDWQRVDGGQQQALPRKPSISDILQQYVDSTKSSRDAIEPEEEVGPKQPLLLLRASCLCCCEQGKTRRQAGRLCSGDASRVAHLMSGHGAGGQWSEDLLRQGSAAAAALCKGAGHGCKGKQPSALTAGRS